MNKERFKTVALCLAAVLLAANTLTIHKLNQKLESYFFKAVQTQNTLEGLQSDVQSQKSELESILRASESMLLEQSVDYQLKSDMIEVTVYAVPKELMAGEVMIAKVSAGDTIYEAELKDDHSATILVEPADTIKTMLQIWSEAGVRQQVLEEHQVGVILACEANSEWMDDSNATPGSGLLLNVQVTGQEYSLPFTEAEIARAEFVVVDSGIQEEGGHGAFRSSSVERIDYASIVEFLEHIHGERIPAHILNASDHTMVFRGDFTEYNARKDGNRYDVAFILETRDGLIYTAQYDYIASLSSSETSSHRSSGDSMLVPVFQK